MSFEKLLRILKVITINVITFLILLVVINWICGFFVKNEQLGREELPNYDKDREHARAVFRDYSRLQHEYYPFVGWKILPFKGPTTTIDATGNRTHTPPAYSGLQQTVHFFGGSTIWGEGSDDQHTIPAIFNTALPQYKVYNHGQLAYNTRQELDALITLYDKKEHPDVVIFYDGVNDGAFLCPTEINELPAHRLVPMYRDKIYVGKTKLIKELMSKVFVENIVRLLRKSKNKDKSPYDCDTSPDKAEKIADMFMTNWELAHEIVTARGGKFIAVLQPAALVGNPRTDHLKLEENLKVNFVKVFELIQKKIRERNHPWIYDLSTSLDNNDYVFIDFCHVSPNGNEAVAKEIVAIVKKEQQTPEVTN
jgi:hypothetical protein